jgi:Flp pilus assembly pilin Flp
VSIIKSLKKLGPAEHALILALVVMVIVLALLLLSGNLQAALSDIGAAKE